MVRNAEEPEPRSDSPHDASGAWLQVGALLAGAVAMTVAFAVWFADLRESFPAAGLLDVVVAGGTFIGTVVAALILTWSLTGRQSRRAAARSREAFQAAAQQIVTSAERATPPPEASLEHELSEISASLAAAVGRLRKVSEKAEAFEAEVRGLIERAEAAKAAAGLHEQDARRIAGLLGAQSEARLRENMARLTAEHNRQLDGLRRAGNRMALWTFVGGVVLGVAGNVVVAVWLG